MTHHKSLHSSLRALRPRVFPLALLLGVSFTLGACGKGRPPDGTDPTQVGSGDQPSNAVLSIDESDIRGTIKERTLTVNVPITSLVDESTEGQLNLRLLSVDGKSEEAVVPLRYSLKAKQSGTFSAELPAPDGLKSQSDLVKFSLRVDDDKELRVTKSLLYSLPLYDLWVEGPANLSPGRTSYFRVRAHDALDNQPIRNQKISFEIVQNDKVIDTQTVTTERTGDAEIEVTLDEPGAFEIRALTSAEGTEAKLVESLEVNGADGKLLLTTDKPVYQPGQVVHLRSLSLSRDGNKPVEGASATFEIEDGKGNKVFKHGAKTDKFGVAHTQFTIGNIVNEGTYKVRVIGEEVTSEKTFDVSHYALPKFDVAMTTAEPWYAPGTTIEGAIDSRYFFGKPVTGSVLVEAYSIDVGTTLFRQVMGTLSDEGHYEFSLDLPASLPGLSLGQGDAVVELRVTVTDSAGQKVEKSRMVTISAQGMNLSLVPEAGSLAPGMENELLLFATDPLGAPLSGASVRLTSEDGAVLDAMTDEFGQATLAFTPDVSQATASTFNAEVTLRGGKTINGSFIFDHQSGADHLLLRTDKSVYEVGETVEVAINTTEDGGTVYVSWLNDGQTVDLRTLTAEDGVASFSTTIDTSLAGSNRIEAYLVDDQGLIVRTGRTIFARSDAALNIEVEADKNIYAPGAPAQLTLSVTDEAGEPAVAALGLQIVDEAVFALVDSKPGLLRTYFEIDDQFAEPQYQIGAPAVDFSSLLYAETASSDEDEARAAQDKAAAALAAMKNTSLTGIQNGTLTAALAQALTELGPYYDGAREAIQAELTDIVSEATHALEKRGCSPDMYQCGTGDFFAELGKELGSRAKFFDFWGNEFSIRTDYSQITLIGSGPDEQKSNQDDAVLSFSLFDLGVERLELPTAVDDGLWLEGAATGGTSSAPPESNDEEGGPRVRSDFPETLYVNPSVITDSNGQAVIDLTMADSITEWRMSALANSMDGRLGGAESGITVFQDFFVDVNFPASLTRGDEITFPIAVYNYLETEQTVDVELQADDWYTPLGATTTSVTLAPGEVRGLGFPVRVNDVGLQSLTVVATGGDKADAVARKVRVVPDGRAYPVAQSGSMESPSATHPVSFPDNTVPGSEQLYVDIYPAFLAQAVQGMDSILATPNGCFEQTTSSAWPNVLVTEYMQETGQITPEIELKAESLMSAGYQRLLTFEHAAGGFSWFGEQDPAPFLSVTAFGIMEFADMSRVHEVDQAMLTRTVQWMEGQQKADGSFEGDKSEFFTFHTSSVRNTAFTAWALASVESNSPAVGRALDYVKANLGSDSDAYTLGIVANAFATGAPNDSFLDDVLSNLEALKKTDGDNIYWDTGDTQTNFYGAGGDAEVSSTALVAHAMLLSGAYPSSVDGALSFLTSKKDANGNFGSTQATIWALRTLLLSAKKGTEGAVGTLVVSFDHEVIQSVELTEDRSDVMTRVDLSGLAKAGDHDVTIDFAGTGKPSYNIVANHHIPWAEVPAEPAGPLSIDVAYDKTSLFVNDTVQATVTVDNNEAVTQNMVLVTLGIAPGFQVNTDDLQPYLDSGAISKFETTGRQLILYITALDPNETQVLTYGLTATMPVTAVDGGAEASMYYEPEKRIRQESQQLVVAQK